MDATIIGIIGLILLLILLCTGLPIAIIFLLLYVGGLTIILDFNKVISMMGQGLYYNVSSPNWAALPLFILLGALATNGGYAQKAFKGLDRLTTGITGALGVATLLFLCVFRSHERLSGSNRSDFCKADPAGNETLWV